MTSSAEITSPDTGPAPDRVGFRPPAWAITAASIFAFFALWEWFGRDVNPVFGSYPSAIFDAFLALAKSGKLLNGLIDSLKPFLAGYGLAVVIGVPLGLIIGRFAFLEAALGVYVTAGFAMPLVALVPLLILWMGLGFMVKMAIIFLMAVFPITINAWLGVRAVPKTLIEVGLSFVASPATILRRIVLPATLPYIMAGLRLAVGRAVVAMIVAEFFTSIGGLGGIIINSANNFDTATMFVPVIVIVLLAIGLTWLIGIVERRVAPWQAEIAGRND
jgi:NitT/TauT family transport system permease protein